MDKRLQAVAIQLARVVTESNPATNISCGVDMSNGYLNCLNFAINMWSRRSSKPKIIKRKSYEFRDSESDTAITKKVVEITNIMNGEINPFEEENDERN